MFLLFTCICEICGDFGIKKPDGNIHTFDLVNTVVALDDLFADEKYGQTLIVSGADLLNGTPIVDIKPYIPYADSHPGVRGGFGESLSGRKYEVVFPDELKELLPAEYRKAVVQILEQDPRPAFIHDEERVWGVFYYDYNIRFTVCGEVITVCGVEKKQSETF